MSIKDLYAYLSETYGPLLAIVKFLSLLVTGVLGVLGMLTEYKDKNGKVTKWGRRALVGIIVSALISICIHGLELTKEKKDSEKALKQANLQLDRMMEINKRAIEIQQDSAKTLNQSNQQLRRMTEIGKKATEINNRAAETNKRAVAIITEFDRQRYPVDDVSITIDYEIDWGDPAVREYHERLLRMVPEYLRKQEDLQKSIEKMSNSGDEVVVPPRGPEYSTEYIGEYARGLIIKPESKLYPDPVKEANAYEAVSHRHFMLYFFSKPLIKSAADVQNMRFRRSEAELWLQVNVDHPQPPDKAGEVFLRYERETNKVILHAVKQIPNYRVTKNNKGFVSFVDFVNGQLFIEDSGGPIITVTNDDLSPPYSKLINIKINKIVLEFSHKYFILIRAGDIRAYPGWYRSDFHVVNFPDSLDMLFAWPTGQSHYWY